MVKDIVNASASVNDTANAPGIRVIGATVVDVNTTVARIEITNRSAETRKVTGSITVK